jgi:hypothetical protein
MKVPLSERVPEEEELRREATEEEEGTRASERPPHSAARAEICLRMASTHSSFSFMEEHENTPSFCATTTVKVVSEVSSTRAPRNGSIPSALSSWSTASAHSRVKGQKETVG